MKNHLSESKIKDAAEIVSAASVFTHTAPRTELRGRSKNSEQVFWLALHRERPGLLSFRQWPTFVR